MVGDMDRLYKLLPAIYRQRDLAQGEPLRALLRVISEQVDIVEDDIGRLYDNWFVETCDDWVLSYIGDLLGYRRVQDEGEPNQAATPRSQERQRILVPRRDVANTIRYRRRKGSLALLGELAATVGGWPCRVVEFDRLLASTQSISHLRLEVGQTAQVRHAATMGRVGSPFDETAHTAELRRPQSHRTRGRYNLPSIGLFIWRLRPFAVTRMQAYCIDRSETSRYTFSVLGNDVPLFAKPVPAGRDAGNASEAELPIALSREALADAHHPVAERYYGQGRSFALWRRAHGGAHLIPRDALVVADLGNWSYRPERGTVAIDPELGRIAFASNEGPEMGLLVSYYYGFSAAMGGGEYPRTERRLASVTKLYVVGPDGDFPTLDEALAKWHADGSKDAVIQLDSSDVFVDPKPLALRADQRLEIRAGEHARPLIDLRNRHRDAHEFLNVQGEAGSSLVLVGLLVAGRGLQLQGHLVRMTIRHCTFVPGWHPNHGAAHEGEVGASIRLHNVRTRVVIEHSIVGPISVVSTLPTVDPLQLEVTDSIIDATAVGGRALDGPEHGAAPVQLTVLRSTVIGRVHVEQIELAENTIFYGALVVTRRQVGCMRFCYVDPESKTPSRFACQPGVAELRRANLEGATTTAQVRPTFNSLRYGTPDYCQLADGCARQITHGAEDESEMGAFHDLYQPQRLANLQARVEECVPAGYDVGIINAS